MLSEAHPLIVVLLVAGAALYFGTYLWSPLGEFYRRHPLLEVALLAILAIVLAHSALFPRAGRGGWPQLADGVSAAVLALIVMYKVRDLAASRIDRKRLERRED